jgi:uncharacterized protein YlaI
MTFQPHQYECSKCKRMIDERRQEVWQALKGWEKKRRQGGTNHVALRRPLHEFMCNNCMTNLLSGTAAEQISMFQDEPR